MSAAKWPGSNARPVIRPGITSASATVILGARKAAAELGVSPDLAENLMRMLIRSSLATQEQISVATKGTGSGHRALVIGGSGKMGRWFVDFMASQGFTVDVSDTAGAPPGFAVIADWHKADLAAYDYIVVATPLGATGGILRELALLRPPGIVFDVGSLKSPLRAGLQALKAHGCQVTSIHPMFGPDTELLSGPACRVRRPGVSGGAAEGARPVRRRPWWNRW